MPNRASDWFRQAERDLEQARESQGSGRHEWACFASHQAAEKAPKALHQHHRQEAWGHVVAELVAQLPATCQTPAELVEKGKVLDSLHIPERFANGHTLFAPFQCFDRTRASSRSPMQVRSLNSSVHKWPDKETVESALREWAKALADRPGVLRIGYYGSYARDDWGVGSDLDVIVVLSESSLPFEKRTSSFPAPTLPVSADLVVYTEEELEDMSDRRFGKMIAAEAIWVSE